MLQRIGLCVLAVVALGAEAPAQNDLKVTLLGEETKLIEAIKQKDKATLRQMLAEQVLSITAKRGRQTARETIRDLENMTFDSFHLSDANAIAVAPDVAILTYKYTWTGSDAGQDAETTTAYATAVWKRRDRKWRSIFYQETPVTEKETSETAR